MAKGTQLKPSQLRWQCDPKLLRFRNLKEVSSCEWIIGQPRAIDAIKLGLNVKYPGYNIFITGPVGTGRTTAITKLLDDLKVKGALKDLLYVNNFKNPDMPKLIELPGGQGSKFRDALNKLIRGLKTNIPDVFDSEEYQKRKQRIVEKYGNQHRSLLKDFEKEVEKQGLKLTTIQMGPYVRPAIVPIIDDKPTNLDEAENLIKQGKLTEEDYQKILEKIRALEVDMAKIYSQIKEIQEAANAELERLNEWMVKPVVVNLVEDIKRKFHGAKIAAHLDEVLNTIMSNLERFLKKETKEEDFREYGVNVVVDNSETDDVPIIFETNPNYKNLFGTIERQTVMPGVITSDFANIKAGSLLRANGGYLIVNAFDALIEPGVWPALKRTLRNGVIDIQVFDPFYVFTTSALKPEPITIDVKVIMIGSQWLYYLLLHQDEDFKKIFKVKADFDTVMDKNARNISEYASFVKSICDGESLLPFSKEAIAEIVEYSVRVAGRKTKLSTRFNIIADTIRESDYWARQAGRKEVRGKDVEQAIDCWRKRMNMFEDKIQEMIDNDVLMISTKGKAVGQLNGLSVYQLGNYSFGRPVRITAKTSLGKAGIINIEREANLGGRTYNKGVLILSGFLRSRYAQDQPMAIDATLGFEQSYSEVDGDSASSAEVYALLSALSDAPLNQELAVTGSVNQHGDVQAIGGVNEKIEGFYEVCKSKGLTGNQGVIIPHANIEDLMLKQEIVDAVAAKKFRIFAVKTVDEGIELLTGIKAGRRTKKGFEKNSINQRVTQKLADYAEKMKGYTKPNKEK
ncbi:MAG: AAA family ATPase [candidate division WOR-3 bacterium]|nr:MAG: AAA family ATPase [candidate division WOR-3 bacterium]